MSTVEIKKRDGMARTGLFSKDGVDVILPSAVEISDLFPELETVQYTNIPLAAKEGFTKNYEYAYNEVVTAHPASEVTASSGDCVMVANWHTALDNPRNYVNWLTTLKQRHPPDAVWYAPAAALPSNVASLIYSGFDLFDFRAVDLKTVQGIFCTVDGEFPAEEWAESGTCNCVGCADGDLKLHNRLALLQEIATVRHFIGIGQLRELMEARCRTSAPQVSILRLLDEAYPFVEQFTPVARSVQLRANSAESIKRPEVRRFAERVIERFIPTRTDVAVLLPCSARKPYSFSQSHRKFQGAVMNRAHELIITSPLGLVPRELERMYPAAHYDVPVTGYWDREERAFIADVLTRYFKKHNYRRVIAHLDGDTLEIAQEAAGRCGIELECTCNGRPTSRESLAALEEALRGERKRRPDIIKGTISWQFGKEVDTQGLVLRGRHMRQRVTRGKTQLFSLDADTGLFRPTFDGWKFLGDGYKVQIDSFVPQGDILAPGIIDVDPMIREGDEVLVQGEHALATGRAAMGAGEMLASRRGVGVRVRKVKKQ